MKRIASMKEFNEADLMEGILAEEQVKAYDEHMPNPVKQQQDYATPGEKEPDGYTASTKKKAGLAFDEDGKEINVGSEVYYNTLIGRVVKTSWEDLDNPMVTVRFEGEDKTRDLPARKLSLVGSQATASTKKKADGILDYGQKYQRDNGKIITLVGEEDEGTYKGLLRFTEPGDDDTLMSYEQFERKLGNGTITKISSKKKVSGLDDTDVEKGDRFTDEYGNTLVVYDIHEDARGGIGMIYLKQPGDRDVDIGIDNNELEDKINSGTWKVASKKKADSTEEKQLGFKKIKEEPLHVFKVENPELVEEQMDAGFLDGLEDSDMVRLLKNENGEQILRSAAKPGTLQKGDRVKSKIGEEGIVTGEELNGKVTVEFENMSGRGTGTDELVSIKDLKKVDIYGQDTSEASMKKKASSFESGDLVEDMEGRLWAIINIGPYEKVKQYDSKNIKEDIEESGFDINDSFVSLEDLSNGETCVLLEDMITLVSKAEASMKKKADKGEYLTYNYGDDAAYLNDSEDTFIFFAEIQGSGSQIEFCMENRIIEECEGDDDASKIQSCGRKWLEKLKAAGKIDDVDKAMSELNLILISVSRNIRQGSLKKKADVAENGDIVSIQLETGDIQGEVVDVDSTKNESLVKCELGTEWFPNDRIIVELKNSGPVVGSLFKKKADSNLKVGDWVRVKKDTENQDGYTPNILKITQIYPGEGLNGEDSIFLEDKYNETYEYPASDLELSEEEQMHTVSMKRKAVSIQYNGKTYQGKEIPPLTPGEGYIEFTDEDGNDLGAGIPEPGETEVAVFNGAGELIGNAIISEMSTSSSMSTKDDDDLSDILNKEDPMNKLQSDLKEQEKELAGIFDEEEMKEDKNV